MMRYNVKSCYSEFAFYKLPHNVATMTNLSLQARFLYMLMYSRNQVSIRNRWFDENGDVYIAYTIKEIANTMGVCETSAKAAKRELCEAGLIEERRVGFGRPNIIYVCHPDVSVDDAKKAIDEFDLDTEASCEDFSHHEGQNPTIRESEYDPQKVTFRPTEGQNMTHRESEYDHKKVVIRPQEGQNLPPNKIEYNKNNQVIHHDSLNPTVRSPSSFVTTGNPVRDYAAANSMRTVGGNVPMVVPNYTEGEEAFLDQYGKKPKDVREFRRAYQLALNSVKGNDRLLANCAKLAVKAYVNKDGDCRFMPRPEQWLADNGWRPYECEARSVTPSSHLVSRIDTSALVAKDGEGVDVAEGMVF